KAVPPTAVIQPAPDDVAPGSTSFTSVVPASVPSDRHNSAPVWPLSAVNSRPPLNAVRLVGPDEAAPARTSLTRTVPAAVPSVFHSSRPAALSAAAKYATPPDTAGLDGLELTAVPAVFTSLTSAVSCGGSGPAVAAAV